MDFRLSDEQEAIRELAARMFAERTSHERLAQLEKSGEWHDRELWAELVRANLTALLVPAEQGGGGSGLFEACLVLEEAGRHLAPVPLFATLLLGSLPIVRFGSPAQQRSWLDPLAQGAVLDGVGEHFVQHDSQCRDLARRHVHLWSCDLQSPRPVLRRKKPQQFAEAQRLELRLAEQVMHAGHGADTPGD